MPDLQPSEVLFIPNRKRLTHAMVAGPAGKQELHIFYGLKEIVFDEPDLMPFGTKLLAVDRFRADEATGWSSAAPYDWNRIRELLQSLLEEEILKRDDGSTATVNTKAYPAKLGRAPEGRQPETWSSAENRCPMTSKRALGHSIDLGNLEMLLPVYRVAHPALDTAGRQVGENNVNDALFLDLPTDRRLCGYAGSRYHNELPMNSTALKLMVRGWPEVLSLTEQFRDAYFARMPRQAGLKAGEVQLLAVGCLATVGYVMVRGKDPVLNGQLDAGLAQLFRLIDGVRMVVTDLVRDTAGMQGCDRPLDAKGVHDYAEKFELFIDAYGVCAGPPALIEEYLKVLLDGAPAPIKVQPDLRTRVGDLDAALDYGFHGVRSEAMVRGFVAQQGKLHERLREAFEQHGAPPSRLRELLEVPVDVQHYPLLRTTHGRRETLEVEYLVDRWLFSHARSGLPPTLKLPESLDEIGRLDPTVLAASRRQLAEFLPKVSETFSALPATLQAELTTVMAEFFALERAYLKAITHEQAMINERLARPAGRPLVGSDFTQQTRRSGPFLEQVLAEGLGLAVAVEVESATLSKGVQALTLT